MKIRRIFHPTDFSPSADAALRFALETALKYGAELCVGHVIFGGREYWDEDDFDNLDDHDLERRLRENVFSEMVKMGWDQVNGVKVTHHVIRQATPDVGITQFAQAQHIDLIVIGMHGRRGVRRFLLGSVATRVLHAARTNVVVVPFGYQENVGGRILVPVDFFERSPHVVRVAAALARRHRIPVDLLHVVDLPERDQLRLGSFPDIDMASLHDVAEERLDTLAGGVEKKLLAMVHVEPGHPAHTILKYIDEHDIRIVVMAGAGMSPSERIRHFPNDKKRDKEFQWTIAPITERIVTHSEVPVWVVKRFPRRSRQYAADAEATGRNPVNEMLP